MGFDPMSIKFIRLAHEKGLGCGDPGEIEIVGDEDAAKENWHFVGPYKKMTFASKMQHNIYWGPLQKPVEWSLKTILAPWAYIASVIYHDSYWYTTHQKIVQNLLHSHWGRLFANWEKLALPPGDLETPGWKEVGDQPAELKPDSMKLIARSLKVLAECIKEAPEFRARKRHESAEKDQTGGS
jgi:hypothetical protein